MQLAPCDDSSVETVCSPCLDLSVMPLVQLSYYHDITMTARAGPVYIDAKGCKLPHATYMTQKILPALDKKLADDVEGKISGLLQVTGQCSFLMAGPQSSHVPS